MLHVIVIAIVAALVLGVCIAFVRAQDGDPDA